MHLVLREVTGHSVHMAELKRFSHVRWTREHMRYLAETSYNLNEELQGHNVDEAVEPSNGSIIR